MLRCATLNELKGDGIVAVQVQLSELKRLKLKPHGKVLVRDVWARKTVAPLVAGGVLELEVAGGDSAFMLLTPE
jgi:hypothetical protein